MTAKDYEVVCEVFRDINLQMSEAMKLFNSNSLKIVGKVFERGYTRAKEFFDFEINEEHRREASEILSAVDSDVCEKVVEAGMIRGFPG